MNQKQLKSFAGQIGWKNVNENTILSEGTIVECQKYNTETREASDIFYAVVGQVTGRVLQVDSFCCIEIRYLRCAKPFALLQKLMKESC